jgi:hypothetical protein
LPQRVPGAAFEAETGHPLPPPGHAPVNERPYRPAEGTEAGRRRGGPGVGDDPAEAEETPGYVVHLPVRVDDAESAARLAYTVASSLAFLPELDPGETTVSHADDQNNRRRVFCDLPLPDRSRCPRRYAHPGPCGPVGSDPGGPVPAPRDHP